MIRVAFWAYGFYSLVYAFNFWRYTVGLAGEDWACGPEHLWTEINWGWIDAEAR